MVQTTSGTGFADLERSALAFEAELRFEEARDAFDAALKLRPDSQSAAEGRARMALVLREDDAADHCSRALAFHESNPERQLRMILLAAAELGGAAIPLLEDFIRRNPLETAAHEAISERRAERGAGERFADR